MLTRILFITLTALLASPALQAANYKRFSLSVNYNYYNDILSDSANQPREISEDIALNVDIRMHRVFIMILHGGQALDGNRNFWGMGFRVDLPGFFMLGGNIQELIRKRKRRGINTSVYWKTYVISEVNQRSNLVGNGFGFSVDFMVTRQAFINLDLGLYSDDGNQFFKPSLGLGYEF